MGAEARGGGGSGVGGEPVFDATINHDKDRENNDGKDNYGKDDDRENNDGGDNDGEDNNNSNNKDIDDDSKDNHIGGSRGGGGQG